MKIRKDQAARIDAVVARVDASRSDNVTGYSGEEKLLEKVGQYAIYSVKDATGTFFVAKRGAEARDFPTREKAVTYAKSRADSARSDAARIDAVIARVDASKELDNLREELAETRKKLERAIRGRDKEEIDELREMIAELQKKIARTDSKGK